MGSRSRTAKKISIDEVIRSKIKVQLSEEEMEDIKLAPSKIDEKKEELDKFKQIIEVITKKNTKTKKYELLPVAQLSKKSIAIKTILSKTHKNSEDLDTRLKLLYGDPTHLLYTNNNKPNEDNSDLILYSKQISKEKIKESLLLINKFIDAYQLFTSRKDKRNQSRIFEIMFYGFMSSYIWKMREHLALEEGRESVRRHFPPFLIIAGRSMSGKTTALEILGMLLGNPQPYMAYESIKNSKILLDYSNSSNVNPVLVDEVDPKFFTSTAADKGERLIKHISNEKKGKHPTMIGSTNATGFDVSAQSAMRIYYLQIDNTFDKSLNAESSKYLSKVISNIDTTLFRDFTYRIGQWLKDGKEFYKMEDFLYAGREIFKDYYAECELDLPDWFPTQLFNDYDERGKFIWRELFRTHRQFFDVRKDDNSIFVDIDAFGKQNARDRANKINFLPPSSIIEDSSVLVLNKVEFFKFIENEYETFFGTIKGYIKKLSRY